MQSIQEFFRLSLPNKVLALCTVGSIVSAVVAVGSAGNIAVTESKCKKLDTMGQDYQDCIKDKEASRKVAINAAIALASFVGTMVLILVFLSWYESRKVFNPQTLSYEFR
jgi:hypothetical protein